MKMPILRIWSLLCALGFVLFLGGALFFLCYNALPQLSVALIFGETPPLRALFSNAPVWEGLWPAIAGTGYLLLLAMAFTLPLGISAGVYLAEYAPQRIQRIGIAFLEVFSSVPSIVIGLFGFILLLLVKKTLLPNATTNLLLAAFCLAVLVLPTFTVTLYSALRSIPHSLRVTTAALGLGRHAAIWNVFVPCARKGAISAFFLAAGRCAEDTAVILMTGAIANASTSPHITGKFEALPFYIYYTTANYQTEAEFMSIFAAAFFLLLLACLLLLTGVSFHKLAFKEWNTTL